MNNKKILLPAFIVMALIQLYIPSKIILDNESVLRSGTIYKFRTAPIDPTDPFRGKYITLNYRETTYNAPNIDDWVMGENIYVTFTTDNNGFAKIESVTKNKPADTDAYLKTKVNYVSASGNNQLIIDYPFDKYYMEESIAPSAELLYNHSRLDTNQVAYSLVSVRKGNAVLKDVLINGVPIREVVKSNQQNSK